MVYSVGEGVPGFHANTVAHSGEVEPIPTLTPCLAGPSSVNSTLTIPQVTPAGWEGAFQEAQEEAQAETGLRWGERPAHQVAPCVHAGTGVS